MQKDAALAREWI